MSRRVTGFERRQQIIDTAATLFAQKGFRGTTTREIAQAVGVSEAALFKYFVNKKELYTAIIDSKSKTEEVLAAAGAAAARGDDRGGFRSSGADPHRGDHAGHHPHAVASLQCARGT